MSKSDLFKVAKDKNALLEIIRDEDYDNPREYCDYLGTMVCFHRNYNLGDKHDYSNPDYFLVGLAQELVGYEDVGLIKEHVDKYMASFTYAKLQDDTYEIYQDEEPYGDYVYDNEDEVKIELQSIRDEYINFIYDELSREDLIELIETKAIILPLFLYDHSGISMSTSTFRGRAPHADWDSGQVGWIYCTKERFMKETGYTEDELFNEDSHRIPKIKERVKLKGHEDKEYYGLVVNISDTLVTVDYGYNRAENFREYKNVVTADVKDIAEVISNYAVEMLVAEVETYNQYLTGDVYGYKLIKLDTNVIENYMEENNVKFEDIDIDELEDVGEEVDSCWGFYGDDVKKNGIADDIGKEYQYLIPKLEYAF